jgi:hypothetical protein
MSQDAPSESQALRTEIERTRADLGDTIEALTVKMDVKTRTKDAVGQATAQAKAWTRDAFARATGKTVDGVRTVSDHTAQLVGGTNERARGRALSVRDSLREFDIRAAVRRPLPVTAIAASITFVGVVVYLARRRRA